MDGKYLISVRDVKDTRLVFVNKYIYSSRELLMCLACNKPYPVKGGDMTKAMILLLAIMPLAYTASIEIGSHEFPSIKPFCAN